jgi:AhpD family alkylhydroperoxidase
MIREKVFDKKIFTAKIFFGDLGFLIWNFPKIIVAMRDQKMTRTFVEKIMTVTSAVNGCIYCSWFHAKQAVNSGITKEEVKNMMELQFHADAKEYELMALLYAQHFAETNRQPDPEMTKKLFDYYKDKTAKHIILVIRMISFGNLYGNTWDAVISRLKGKPAPYSNILFEIFYFLLNFLIMVPAMFIIKKDKKDDSKIV